MKLLAPSLATLLLLCSQLAHAQHNLSTPEGQDSADAARLESAYRSSFMLPVLDQPYAADEVTETVRKLADGNEIRTSRRLHKMRDHEGRQRYTIVNSLEREHTIVIDPVAKAAWLIRPERKDVLRLTGLPQGRYVNFATTGAPSTVTWSKQVWTSLGVKDFDGIAALGTQIETTLRPGAFGIEREMQETSESWRNNEKQLALYTRHSSPRNGERIVRLENIRTDPLPQSAFALPADYAVRDVKPEPLRVAAGKPSGQLSSQ